MGRFGIRDLYLEQFVCIYNSRVSCIQSRTYAKKETTSVAVNSIILLMKMVDEFIFNKTKRNITFILMLRPQSDTRFLFTHHTEQRILSWLFYTVSL